MDIFIHLVQLVSHVVIIKVNRIIMTMIMIMRMMMVMMTMIVMIIDNIMILMIIIMMVVMVMMVVKMMMVMILMILMMMSYVTCYLYPINCITYKGYEGCETRWDIGKDWWKNCNDYLTQNQIPWIALFNDSSDDVNNDNNNDVVVNSDVNKKSKVISKKYDIYKIYQACSDTSPQAIKLNLSIIPKIYNRVMVITALWDFNYHHFLADSLARLIKYISFLRLNTDIMIHIRGFEEYDTDPIKSDQAKYDIKIMRNRMFDLLGINSTRVIYGPILARHVYIPRALHCAYTLSNPLEIRLMAHELLLKSFKSKKAINTIKKYNLFTHSSYSSSNNNGGSGSSITTTIDSLLHQNVDNSSQSSSSSISSSDNYNRNISWNIIFQQRHSPNVWNHGQRNWENQTFEKVSRL